MTARLHVVLGPGGVGKTTLAAGYALALARGGSRRVGLLGIDPSRRLKDALGIALGDADAAVPAAEGLRAALLQPAESLRRWAAEASTDPASLQRLLANPFFAALADRLATATDIFAAARVAEWSEHEPLLTDLVVDTAPGLNAIEFLTRPERVAAFLGGRMVGWLRWLAREPTGGSLGLFRGGARRVFGGLARMAGSRMLSDLAEFFSLVEAMFTRLLMRVQVTQRWLQDPSTELLVVTCVRGDGAEGASELAEALAGAGLVPRAVVVNRCLPVELAAEIAALEAKGSVDARAEPLLRYALAYVAIQARVVVGVGKLAATTAVVADARGLDGEGRLDVLAELGRSLRLALG